MKDGTAYPRGAVHDRGQRRRGSTRANSRKMTARLQAANAGRPVLLRTSHDSGHGMGTALRERIEEYADGLAFLFHELGIPFPGAGREVRP